MTLPKTPAVKLSKPFLGFYRLHPGYCPICRTLTVFLAPKVWLRDHYYCYRCKSIPRYRALIDVLEKSFPRWRTSLAVHESSPCGAASDFIARECLRYTATHFFPDVEPGGMQYGFRSENLEAQTFPDGAFDLVITQDVFEHILHPGKAFAEIARTLKPGGAHLFTVPWYHWRKTETRAAERGGTIVNLLPPVYHGNPIDASGSLVVTDWGSDMADFILRESNLATRFVRIRNPWKGIEAEFIEVFISTKPD
jgi:SAM-dependent methyltransferase